MKHRDLRGWRVDDGCGFKYLTCKWVEQTAKQRQINRLAFVTNLLETRRQQQCQYQKSNHKSERQKFEGVEFHSVHSGLDKHKHETEYDGRDKVCKQWKIAFNRLTSGNLI